MSNPQFDTPTPNTGPITSDEKSKKLIAGLLAIFLGSLGIHKFFLGYTKEGAITLGITVITCFMASPITGIIALIEGILYLTKSDEEFVQTYVRGRKGWF